MTTSTPPTTNRQPPTTNDQPPITNRPKFGILGGTFDPPHIGHLILADFAESALALDAVLFVPAGDPPHKQGTRTRETHRVAMLERAIASEPRWSIDLTDVERPGPHYSVDMVKLIAAKHPDAELFFIMGGDSFRDLPSWSRPQELITLCQLLVMERPNVAIDLKMHEAGIPGLAARSLFIDAPLISVSSTDIIRWRDEQRPIHHLLPTGVLDYIETHGLY
jgi:nicotinate-nucleotide adenylyltransferase